MAFEPNELEEIHYANLASHIPDSTDTSGESEDERDPDFIVEEISHSQEQPAERRGETSGAGGRRGRGRGRRRGRGRGRRRERGRVGTTRDDTSLNPEDVQNGKHKTRMHIHPVSHAYHNIQHYITLLHNQKGHNKHITRELSQDIHFLCMYIGWTQTPTPVSVEPCTTPHDPLVSTTHNALEMFSCFFTEEVLHVIVNETNRFAAQCLAATNSNTTWSTDISEIQAYFGFMVVMGLNQLPEIRDYWSTDSKLNNQFISSRITRKRFEEISRYLHLWTTQPCLQGMSLSTIAYRRYNQC